MARPAGLGIVAALGLVAAVGLGPATPRAAPPEPEPAPEVGREAPDFTLPDLDGGPVRLAGFRGRQAVLVNFWATWCVPCREEMPMLDRLWRQRRDTLVVLGVSLDTASPARVRAFVREVGAGFPILRDPDQTVARRYRLRGVPSSFLVDRGGVIRYREVGYRDWTDAESRRMVEETLRAR